MTRRVSATRVSTFRALAILALGAASLSSAGCSYEGGSLSSMDQFLYVSREWEPKTVTLIDTRTGESLWSVDVPVGKQLSVGFRKGAGPNPFKPDMMDWGMSEHGRTSVARPNQMPVPAAGSRRLEFSLRPTPEMPGSALPGSPFDAGSGVPEARQPAPMPTAADQMPSAPAPQPTAPPETRQVEPAAPQPQGQPQEQTPPVDIPQGTRGTPPRTE
jgi:hypothetical protein